MAQDSIGISLLWDRLKAMEEELRFEGEPYPRGMCPMPFRLRGQSFFPGGDGLWREDESLGASGSGQAMKGGILFLGNDFGTLKQYKGLKNAGFENVPTWRNIKTRVRAAQVPASLAFFTNAIMGLREEGTALTKRSWQKDVKFSKFCGEFLHFQLLTLKPKLVVVMGPEARRCFEALVTVSGDTEVLYTGHPYADFGLTLERRKKDVDALYQAWSRANLGSRSN